VVELAHCNKRVLVWLMETSGSPKAVHSWQYIAPTISFVLCRIIVVCM